MFAYAGEVKELVAWYKFSHRTRLAVLFAQYLGEALSREMPGVLLVPAPARSGPRAVDHVERIARVLERRHGAHVVRALERVGGVSQKTLDFEARKKNLAGAIRARRNVRVPREAVLLDDIFTTGATADACATALKDAGCGSVHVLTLAIDL